VVLNDSKPGDKFLIEMIDDKRTFLEQNKQIATTQGVLIALLGELAQRRMMDEGLQYPDPNLVLNVSIMETILNAKLDMLANYLTDSIVSKLSGLAIAPQQRTDFFATEEDYTLNDIFDELGWNKEEDEND
jgi:hypothetical protein